MFTNYDEGILAYIASIRNYLGLESSFKANERFSKVLEEKKPEQIILALIDGMGSRLIERKLDENTFLRKHMLTEVETVFPPTTTAATTAICNGKAPNKNAWLGWTHYVKEVDDIIIPFFGKGSYSGIDYGQDYFYKLIPVTNTVTELNTKGIGAHEIYPAFRENGVSSIQEFGERIVNDSMDQSERYIYAYWDAYDSMLHKLGVDVKESDDYLKEINEVFENIAPRLNEGTMLVVVADHGLVDIEEEINIYETKLNDYLIRPTTCEPRATMFYVLEDKKEAFEKEFKEMYSDDFILLTKQQVIDAKVFGPHESSKEFERFLGDFLAIAKNHKHFLYSKEKDHFKFKASHAGCHIDERMIPFIVYQRED